MCSRCIIGASTECLRSPQRQLPRKQVKQRRKTVLSMKPILRSLLRLLVALGLARLTPANRLRFKANGALSSYTSATTRISANLQLSSSSRRCTPAVRRFSLHFSCGNRRIRFLPVYLSTFRRSWTAWLYDCELFDCLTV